ncbi:hypothetical protein MY4038_009746 [Beauveria bassiana]
MRQAESPNSPENGSICTTDLPNVEYYGPRSFMSFCSPPGVKWINSRLECPQLGSISSQLIAGVAGKLKLNGKLSAPMTGDPAPERAWEYAKTYFDEAAEQSFGIVERLWFEARLRKHLDGTASDDTGWFALRNAVWALGARLSISKTSTYGQALSKSWLFFEKALSVHTEMILFSSSLPAVQALALMVYYAEGAVDDAAIDCQIPGDALSGKTSDAIYCHINTPLFYPWSPPASQQRPDPQLVAQIEASCGAVVRSSRFIILATRQIDVDASCSALVSLFVPVYSFITQFIYILQCDAAHAQSELDIMDLALGYFANLKYATDGLVFLPFAKELASIASTYVDQQRNKPPKPSMDNSILEASQCGLAIEDETANIYDNADSSLLLEEASFEGWDSLLPSLTTWDTVL